MLQAKKLRKCFDNFHETQELNFQPPRTFIGEGVEILRPLGPIYDIDKIFEYQFELSDNFHKTQKLNLQFLTNLLVISHNYLHVY